MLHYINFQSNMFNNIKDTYRISFGDIAIHSKSRFVIIFNCFRFLRRQVSSGYTIHISKY